MTQDFSPSKLSLVVTNPQALQRGSTPRHSFGSAGGTIGSQGADWSLHDAAGRIQPLHCEIQFDDGAFILIDRCGETRVNDQSASLSLGTCVTLRNRDTLHVGSYQISVCLNDEQHALLPDTTRLLAQHGVDELVGATTVTLDDSLSEDHALPILPPGNPPDGCAEFEALAEPGAPLGQLDPLRALEDAERRYRVGTQGDVSLDPTHYGMTPLAAQADHATTRFEAVSGAPMLASGDIAMSDHDTQSAAALQWLNAQQNQGGNSAGLVAPLVEGLGASVGALDAHAAYALLLEAGQTLSALIRGLSALHAAQPGQPHRALAGRTLQPIEDNPLRLAQSYADTVRALFSTERSLVHLSPSAAVQESLEQIHRQQSAIDEAVSKALGALLAAFSPAQLEQRFSRYRSGATVQASSSGWAWEMYRHYYEELVSSRQQGFDRLFWEVFDQAYDQALRSEAQ